ncbi:MAG: tetratricopeptide repeat protein [Bacteroidota bacterium]
MKKLVLGLLAFLLMVGTVAAQDGKKALKKAIAASRTYSLDPQKNGDKLDEAIAAFETATTADDTKTTARPWIEQGNLYTSICTNHATYSSIDPTFKKAIDNAAMLAYQSYEKAKEYAQKRDPRAIQKGIGEVQGYLVSEGADYYEKKEYDQAYIAFQYSLDAHDYLTENGKGSIFADDAAYQEQMYYTGLAALSASKTNDARPIFMKLKEAGYEKPAIYEALYQLEVETDRDAALAILEAGRAKFPDEVSLLFQEINHYLKDGRLGELVGKLQSAIEKEPDNITLYTTLGSIYDNLYQKALESGDTEAAQKNFDEAFKTYSKALEKDEKFFDAIYSIGALYYNRAAATTKQMNALADDYSKAGLKKYDELRKLVLTQFDEALPYFKQAEALNPSDRNTLIALKEIFARKDDLPTSTEFKNRLETIEAGGTIDASYFNE